VPLPLLVAAIPAHASCLLDAPAGGEDRIMIYGPKADGTYIIEFRTAAGEALAISV